jgi:hypothetical protein
MLGRPPTFLSDILAEGFGKLILGLPESSGGESGIRYRAAPTACLRGNALGFHWEMLLADSENVLASGVGFLIVDNQRRSWSTIRSFRREPRRFARDGLSSRTISMLFIAAKDGAELYCRAVRRPRHCLREARKLNAYCEHWVRSANGSLCQSSFLW